MKSAYRNFSVTVRAVHPPVRRRAPTSLASSAMRRCSAERCATSRANVSSRETLFGAPGMVTGALSMPRARSHSDDPDALPTRRCTVSSGSAASCPSVEMPRPLSARSAAGPSPGSRRSGSGARNAASSPGSTTTNPRGFRRSDAILATVLHVATPKETCRPRRGEHAIADLLGDVARAAEAADRARDVEKRLVERQRLDERRVVARDVEHRRRRAR